MDVRGSLRWQRSQPLAESMTEMLDAPRTMGLKVVESGDLAVVT